MKYYFLVLELFFTCLLLAQNSQVYSATTVTGETLESSKHHKKHHSGSFGVYESETKSLHRPRFHKKVFIQKSYAPAKKAVGKKTNSTNKTKPKRPGIFPNGVHFEKNKDIDMLYKKNLGRYSKCKEKTGALYLLTTGTIKDKKNPKNITKGLILKPAFVVLTENSLAVQASQDPKSLIQAALLDKILRVTQTYRGTTCFDIIEEKKENKPIELCSETPEEMNSWVVGILEMKECLLKDKFELVDANANAFAKKEAKKKKQELKLKKDIKKGKGTVPLAHKSSSSAFKITSTKVSKSSTGKTISPLARVEVPSVPQIDPSLLYYTNNFSPDSEILEITETDKALTKILNDKKREELAQRQVRRQIEDRIRKVKEAHKKIKLQQKVIQKKAAASKKKEIAIATHKIENQAKKLEKAILNKAIKSMQKMNKQDLEEYKVAISKPIIAVKKRTRSQVQRIMKMAEQSKVNQPFDECLDNRLEGFKDKGFVKSVCQKMFGEDLCETCEQKENFCNKCCSHRVGSNFVNKLAKCKVQCNALIS